MSEGISPACPVDLHRCRIDIAKTAKPGSTILCMLPDTRAVFVISAFEKIEEEMTSEEIALLESTPGYQMPSGTNS